MKLYPDIYLNNIKEVTLKLLEENNIKGLILDIDNTLIDLDRNLLEGSIEWCEKLKNNNIKMCIVSNTNKLDKVKKVANSLNLPFISFAKKPCKGGLKKAQKILDLESKNIGVIGDQIFTDVLGAKRMGMFAILTKPIDEKDIWITKIKRPIENLIINKYLQEKETK